MSLVDFSMYWNSDVRKSIARQVQLSNMSEHYYVTHYGEYPNVVIKIETILNC